MMPAIFLGLPDDRVTLRPYTPLWHWLFLLDKQRLQRVLKPHVLDIQHVGSTAIPGMVAKPILEILVAIADFEQGVQCISGVERLGYVYQGENEALRQYRFIKGHRQTHSLYIVEYNSQAFLEKIYFRDYLKNHPKAAQKYASLKHRLARKYPGNRIAYQKEKEVFIQQVLSTRAGFCVEKL